MNESKSMCQCGWLMPVVAVDVETEQPPTRTTIKFNCPSCGIPYHHTTGKESAVRNEPPPAAPTEAAPAEKDPT